MGELRKSTASAGQLGLLQKHILCKGCLIQKVCSEFPSPATLSLEATSAL